MMNAKALDNVVKMISCFECLQISVCELSIFLLNCSRKSPLKFTEINSTKDAAKLVKIQQRHVLHPVNVYQTSINWCLYKEKILLFYKGCFFHSRNVEKILLCSSVSVTVDTQRKLLRILSFLDFTICKQWRIKLTRCVQILAQFSFMHDSPRNLTIEL